MTIKELGHVVLYVSDLKRSADFYRDTLGFREIVRDENALGGAGIALFSSGRTHHELLLIEIGGESEEARRIPKPGLYHIGFKIGDGSEALRAVWRELRQKDVRIVGASDHGVTHSLYVLDPDGNELELYADVFDAWKKDPRAVMAPIKPLLLE